MCNAAEGKTRGPDMSGGYDGGGYGNGGYGGGYGGYGGGYGDGGYGPPPNRSNGIAVAALVCGIVGLLCLQFILGPLAIVFGGIGLSKANQGAENYGLAVAGLVLGIIATAIAVIVIAAYGSPVPYL